MSNTHRATPAPGRSTRGRNPICFVAALTALACACELTVGPEAADGGRPPDDDRYVLPGDRNDGGPGDGGRDGAPHDAALKPDDDDRDDGEHDGDPPYADAAVPADAGAM